MERIERMRKAIYLGVGTIFTSVILLELMLFGLSLRTRRRAESLLATTRTLKLGTSTFADLTPILNAENAEKIGPSSTCPSADAAYGIRISNSTINRIGLSYPALLRVGVRPVSATLSLSFTGGRLCEFRFATSSVVSGTEYASTAVDSTSARLVEVRTETAVQRTAAPDRQSGDHYLISEHDSLFKGAPWPGRTFELEVSVNPETSPRSLENALAFDLKCFTFLAGCRTRYEMLPRVFEDAIHTLSSSEMYILPKETKCQECAEVTRSTVK